LKVDAAIACCPENVYYTSGFWTKMYDQTFTHLQEAWAVQTREGSDALIVPRTISGDIYVHEPVSKNILYSGEYPVTDEPKYKTHPDSMTALKTYLASEGLEKGVLGIEGDMSWNKFNELKKALPEAKFVDVAASFFMQLRRTKTKEEVARMTEACHITEMAFLYMLENAKEGMYETDVANLLRQYTARTPTVKTVHLDVASGPRSAWPSDASPRKRLKRGEIVRIDFGVRYKHYCSDLSRNTIVGPPNEEQVRMNRVLDEAGQIVIKNMRPGVKCHDLYQMCHAHVAKTYPKYSRQIMGHAIGLTIHDEPWIRPGVQDILEPGMVITSETAWNRYGYGTMNVEDVILVTENEPESLSVLNRDLYTIRT
jgi:Xaa-Pro aminopeptidase